MSGSLCVSKLLQRSGLCSLNPTGDCTRWCGLLPEQLPLIQLESDP
jgi:hypothetical protein